MLLDFLEWQLVIVVFLLIVAIVDCIKEMNIKIIRRIYYFMWGLSYIDQMIGVCREYSTIIQFIGGFIAHLIIYTIIALVFDSLMIRGRNPLVEIIIKLKKMDAQKKGKK